MFDMTRWTRGPIHHCKQIGKHEEHKAVRERTEARLAALKNNGVLTEKELPRRPVVPQPQPFSRQSAPVVVRSQRPTLLEKLGATLSAASLTLRELDTK